MSTLGTLTDRQSEVLTTVIDLLVDNGFCPSFRELQAKLGIKSGNGIHEHIAALERKGYLHVHKGCARGLVVKHYPDGRPFKHVWQDLTNLEAEVSHA
jgi:SOS-response transcriptional repressor LexA